MTPSLRRSPRPAAAIAATALAAATVAVGTSGSAVAAGRGAAAGATPPASAQAARPAADRVTRLTLTTRVRSADSTLHTLPGGVTYGWNLLTGTTQWGGSTAAVEFLGSVSYVDGDGPFTGLVTVTRPNGTTLSFRVVGTAVSTATGTSTADATFTGDVSILGGTGPWARSRGIGTMTGSRTAALGGAVRLTFRLTVVR